MEKDMDALIEKKMKNRSNNANEVRYPFGSNTEESKKQNENQKYQDDDDEAEYVIEGAVVQRDITNPKDSKQVGLNDAGWEESKETIVYTESKPAQEAKKPKWGDAIIVSRGAEIPESELFFPSLGDTAVDKRSAKDKDTKKNSGLMGSKSDSMGMGSGNWGPRDGGITSGGLNSRFGEAGPVRFTSKGGESKLNKFMQSGDSGPTYDANLEEAPATVGFGNERIDDTEDDLPKQFKGKVKIGTQETDADLQRKQYLKECQDRAELEDMRHAEEKDAPLLSRFTNSKGAQKNNGLFMSGDQQQQAPVQENNSTPYKDDGPRTFTNSKKVTKEVSNMPTLDPSIPTVAKGGITIRGVTANTWD